jgi:hypothetical protein
MNFDLDIGRLDVGAAAWLKELKIKFRKPLRILFVADSSVSFTGEFGVGRVIDLLRSTSFGWVDFQVDLARREGAATFTASPGGHNPHYTGFRFDRTEANGTPTLNKYHEVFCFGFRPGNDGSPNDGNISGDALRLLATERTALNTWMDTRRGGLFATGDHHYLGASLASTMPRIGTMRRWTNAQGVPPIGGENRIDAHRPGNAAQESPTFAVMFGSERDSTPQPIQWVTWMGSIFTSRSPHPILCHPQHGPINVMPDHNHEGRCFDTALANFEVNISSATEYPTVGGIRPLPQIIAYGQTLGDPPYMFNKGDHTAKRFPMISVYDGQRIGIGRVVTDSTWHHWMDLNLAGIEAAATAAGASDTAKENWDKISRYFVNIAIWLATPALRKCMFHFYLLRSHFAITGIQEFGLNLKNRELGSALSLDLRRWFGPCWVRGFVLDSVFETRPDLSKLLDDHYFPDRFREKVPPIPQPDACLTCPPWDELEADVLGAVVRESLIQIEPIRQELFGKGKIKARLDEKQEFALIDRGIALGLSACGKAIEKDAKDVMNMAKVMQTTPQVIPKPAKKSATQRKRRVG